MAVRFRIRTSAGQELSFASHEMFEDFVRSGDLSPDDLVYDADTESWSSARTHPIVLEIEYGSESASGFDADEFDAVAEPSDDVVPELLFADVSIDDGFGLELAPPPDPQQQQEARDFVAKMEAEREASLRRDGVASARLESGSGTLAELGAVGDTLAPRPEVSPRRREPSERRRDDADRSPVSRRGPSTASAAPTGRRAAPLVGLAFLIVALGGAGGYAGFRLVSAAPPESPVVDPGTPVEPMTVEPAPPTPPPGPVIEPTPAAVTERARERFLTAARTEMRNLPPIPDAWPSGRYLSLPSEYPGVVDVWQSYLYTMRAVRARDVQRYGEAYESALDDAQVQRAVLVGHSNGTPAIRQLYRDHPERVAGLVVIDGPLQRMLSAEAAAPVL